MLGRRWQSEAVNLGWLPADPFPIWGGALLLSSKLGPLKFVFGLNM